TFVVAVPAAFVKMARYFSPLCDWVTVKVKLVLVAPVILVQVVPVVLDCHCTVGFGVPVAVAVNVTKLPAVMVWLTGWVLTAGSASTVNVAALEVPKPLAFANTARYSYPVCPRVAVKL